MVSLSATVSNAEEFGEWLETVRGETTTIVEERRPVPLYQHVMVGTPPARPVRLLRRRRGRRLRQGGRPGQRRAGQARPRRLGLVAHEGPPRAQGRSAAGRRQPRRQAGRQRPPGLDPVALRRRSSALDREGLLPAIVFIFSRVGCDAAVTQCLSAGHPADHPRGARRDPRVRRVQPAATCPPRTCRCSATTTSSTGSPAASRRTTPACCRRSSRSSRSSTCAGSARSSSPPRPWPWASTCRRAPW